MAVIIFVVLAMSMCSSASSHTAPAGIGVHEYGGLGGDAGLGVRRHSKGGNERKAQEYTRKFSQ
mgnify:CR=1 FL=1